MSYEYGKRGRGIMRVDLGDLTRIRYRVNRRHFEILVHPQQAWSYRQGEKIPLEDIIEDFIIFDDFSQGQKTSVEDLITYFGTDDEKKIIDLILHRGELLITQEQRNLFLKEKREEIVRFLAENAVNSKTKVPYPPQRIEKAILESGYNINMQRSSRDQAIEIIKLLQKILPMSLEKTTIQFTISPADSARMNAFLHNQGEIIDENWNSDGSLVLLLRVPSARRARLLDDVRDYSKGRVRSTVIERSE